MTESARIIDIGPRLELKKEQEYLIPIEVSGKVLKPLNIYLLEVARLTGICAQMPSDEVDKLRLEVVDGLDLEEGDINTFKISMSRKMISRLVEVVESAPRNTLSQSWEDISDDIREKLFACGALRLIDKVFIEAGGPSDPHLDNRIRMMELRTKHKAP